MGLSSNPLYAGGRFHCYMLDESICHFWDVGSFCRFYSFFLWKILLANNVGPDQTPHYVASDLGPHCLSTTPLLIYYRRKYDVISMSLSCCVAIPQLISLCCYNRISGVGCMFG